MNVYALLRTYQMFVYEHLSTSTYFIKMFVYERLCTSTFFYNHTFTYVILSFYVHLEHFYVFR